MNGQGCPMRGQGVAHGGQGYPMGVRGAPWGVTEVHSFFNEEMINQMTNPLKIKKMGVTNEKMGI